MQGRTALVTLSLLALLAAPTVAAKSSPFEGRWDLLMNRPGWQPDPAHGVLVLARGSGGWSGHVTFQVLMNGRRLPLASFEAKGKSLSFDVEAPGQDIRMEVEPKQGRLVGHCAWKGCGRFPVTAEKAVVGPVERFEKGLKFKGRFRKGDAEKLGLDGDAIDDLVRRAAGADTDALLVMKDGKIVCERTFGRPEGPIHIMSVTKFVTAIAVGMLLEEKKIGSLDAPLSTWFPEWKEGEKAKVTLRHVLTHTSGIAHQKTARELNQQTDKVAYVRRAKIAAAPGTVHFYNNDAVALLSGVLAKAAGRPVDAYLKSKLFAPLGIDDFKWDRDGAGNTFTYANLQMTARDLALVGQMVADGGKVGRKSLLASKTISQFGSPSTPLEKSQGLLWRLHRDEKGKVRAYYHTGWLGQHLLVYPREKLVAVRLRRWKNEREAEKPEFMLGSIRSLLDAALSR